MSPSPPLMSSPPRRCARKSTACGRSPRRTLLPKKNRPPRATPIKSVMFITHLIDEAVFLADRIVVMGTRPGHIRQIVVNDIPHPRDYQTPAFLEMVRHLHDIIVSEHLPEAAAAVPQTGPAAPLVPAPLPHVSLGEMVGLMEILRDRGGRADIFALNSATAYDFGHILAVIKTGELLGFLITPRNSVNLTTVGNKFLDADINGRKQVLNRQLRDPQLTFKYLLKIIGESADKRISRDLVMEELAMLLPTEDVEKLTDTIISWGRHAELIAYSSDDEILSLEEEMKVAV